MRTIVMGLVLAVCGGVAMAQAPGETCAAATRLPESFALFSTAPAGADAPGGSCNEAGVGEMRHAVWYWYEPAGRGQVRLVASFGVGSPFAGIVAVYAGACGSLTEVACDGGDASADLAFQAELGERYLIQIGAYGEAGAGGQTLLTVLAPGDRVGSCSGVPIACGQSVEFDSSVLGADAPAGSCAGEGTTAHAAWFTHTAGGDGELLVSLDTGGAYEGVVTVFRGGCGSLVEVACGAGGARFDASAGETYVIQAGAASGEGGVSSLALCCDCPPACPCDLTADGSLNFDDLDAFVAAYLGGDPAADFTGDGTLNFDDLDAFIACYLGGCAELGA